MNVILLVVIDDLLNVVSFIMHFIGRENFFYYLYDMYYCPLNVGKMACNKGAPSQALVVASGSKKHKTCASTNGSGAT